MVEGVVELPGGVEGGVEARFLVDVATDADLLVVVLDEVIYRLDTAGQIPVRTSVSARPEGGFEVVQQVVDLQDMELTGAAPKAVSLHQLAFGPDETGWRCAVTLDV